MNNPASDRYNMGMQPALVWKHKKTLRWISTAALWKREMIFFQKLLDGYVTRFSSESDKAKISHFQNLIIYYRDELIHQLVAKLRQHERRLAEVLAGKAEEEAVYLQEHATLMDELEATSIQFNSNKEALFSFIERVI